MTSALACVGPVVRAVDGAVVPVEVGVAVPAAVLLDPAVGSTDSAGDVCGPPETELEPEVTVGPRVWVDADAAVPDGVGLVEVSVGVARVGDGAGGSTARAGAAGELLVTGTGVPAVPEQPAATSRSRPTASTVLRPTGCGRGKPEINA